MDELFACEVGTALWLAYRAMHPEAPTIPPEAMEDWPDAKAYWAHASNCADCNEA